MLVVVALAAAGCSVHPLPDDVPPYLPTEDIVKSARCEMRLGLFDQVAQVLKDKGVKVDTNDLKKKEGRKRIETVLKRDHKELLKTFNTYAKVAVAYDFDFGITEHNNVDAGLAFKLPLVNGVFDLGASGSLHKTRLGQRTFKAQETFRDLVYHDTWCNGFEGRDKNLLYPITGSIGLKEVVKTFIAISEQGGGKDTFVDTLTFTTSISGKLGPSVKLNPVPNTFRLVSADAAVAADRTDVHKIVISLAFPEIERPKDSERETREDAERLKKAQQALKKQIKRCDAGICPTVDIAGEYKLNPVWRARYNICVADARNREDTFKALRHSSPEVYCLAYADAFVSRVEPVVQALLP